VQPWASSAVWARWPFGCGGRGAVNELLQAARLLADAAALLARAVAAGRDPGAAVPPVFTVPTLAAHLRRSASTIRQWCERGELEARRVKGRWYITADAVERFLGGAPPEPRADVAPGAPITPAPGPRARPPRGRPTGLGAWRVERERKVRGT